MEKINEIIKNELTENNIYDIEEFTYLSNMINIILSEKLPSKEQKYKKRVPLCKSIKYTNMFLNYLDPSYANIFLKRLENNQIEFEKDYEDNNKIALSDMKNNENYIYIPYQNNIGDTFMMTHEVIHDISLEPEISLARSFYCEVFSLLSEKLQKDYFEKYFHIKEYQINDKNMLCYMKENTICIQFELRLISEYLEKGYLTKMDILNVIETFDMKYAVLLWTHVKTILEEKEFTLFLQQRYVVGYLLASFMHERILNDPKKIEEFLELNEIINDYTEKDFLDYLGLELDNGYYFNLTEESYKQLQKSYHNEVKRVRS